jgi:hypothetical protein
MQGKITKRTVDALKPGAKDRFLWDTELKGFGLKVTPSGNKIYVLQYRRGAASALTVLRPADGGIPPGASRLAPMVLLRPNRLARRPGPCQALSPREAIQRLL